MNGFHEKAICERARRARTYFLREISSTNMNRLVREDLLFLRLIRAKEDVI